MTQAISYIRFSSEKQAQGDSLRRQLALSEAYARDHGLDLVDTRLRDLGLSGFSGAHRGGALGTLLAMVESGQVEPGTHLLVESFDRLSREHVDEALELFMSLIRRGIVVVTLADGHAYSRESIRANWTQLIISLSIMARAHEESATKSHRKLQSEATKRANASTRKVTSIGPGWLRYDRETDSFVEVPDRVAVVRRIYADLISGLGKGTIANSLNEEGVSNFGSGRHGKAEVGWHASAVDKIAHWRATLGEFQPHRMVTGRRVPVGDPVAGYFPVVIDEATYHRAQAAMRSRATGGGGRTGETYANLFAKVTRCGSCGAPLHLVNKGTKAKAGQPFLTCSAARRKVRSADGATARCTNKRKLPYAAFEREFLRLVSDIDLTGPVPNDGARIAAELATKEAEREALKKRIARLVTMIEDGDEIADAYRQRKAELANVEADIRRLTATAATMAPDDAPQARQEALRRLRVELATAAPAELYRLRAGLAATIRNLNVSVTVMADERIAISVGQPDRGNLSFYVLFGAAGAKERTERRARNVAALKAAA